MTRRHIAILVDGGFFLKRLPKLVPPGRCDTPEHIAETLNQLCRAHVRTLTGADNNWNQHLYRVFYYDAMPYDGKAHHPIDNRSIDYAKSDVARHRLALFDCLREKRKFALRLGKVNRDHDWTIKPELTKKLLKTRSILAALADSQPQRNPDGSCTLSITQEQWAQLQTNATHWQELDGSAVSLGLRQKGVDMRIGIESLHWP